MPHSQAVPASAPRLAGPHPSLSAVDLKAVHPEAVFLRIFGVNYVHLKADGDLYLTPFGLPFLRQLMPENWYENEWFTRNKQRLQGTSTVYRIKTKPIDNALLPSIDIVIKWSRVGMEVDLNTFTLDRNTNAEFNSPFEEFALLEELRRGDYGPKQLKILTQKPLAIFAPPERFQAWQTGRSREKVLQRNLSHPGVAIDVLRSYILIYAWIDGVNAVDAFAGSYYDLKTQHRELLELTHRVDREMAAKGFVVADHKPTHFILRMRNGIIRRRMDGRLPYALVDYELLARTPKHDDFVRARRRTEYLIRQRDRFAPRDLAAFPEHLHPMNVLGVDYVFGRSESTNGVQWVVGNDPDLFAYFLPERWRGMQVRLSGTGQTYYTQTKDRIHLVWKVSRVGELPAGDLTAPDIHRVLVAGYNNPFEEISLASKLAQRGVKTIYPRAIYMTASPGEVAAKVVDDRAYRRIEHLRSPEGQPVLPMHHDYITIWGYWRGVEDQNAASDPQLWTPIDAAGAAAQGLITAAQVESLMASHAEALRRAGFEDASLNPDHLLLSHIPGGAIKTGPDGQFEVRQCNFELLRELSNDSSRSTADFTPAEPALALGKRAYPTPLNRR